MAAFLIFLPRHSLVAPASKLWLCACFLWALHAGWAHADIYTYTDSNGVQHLSNIPPTAEDAELLTSTLHEGPAAAALKTANAAPTPPPVSPKVLQQRRAVYAPLITQVAQETQVEAEFLHAIITAESSYNPMAKSKKGAQGLMQLMPQTARRYGVENAFDPLQNLQGGAKYLRDLIRQFGDLRLVSAAFNAGENAVLKYGMTVPPYRETQAYVPKVIATYNQMRQANAGALPTAPVRPTTATP